MLIRVGDTVVNLDNVLYIDLNWDPDGDEGPQVVFGFNIRGSDKFAGGESIAHPYLKFFSGGEAEALRRHLKKLCPDLLGNGGGGD